MSFSRMTLGKNDIFQQNDGQENSTESEKWHSSEWHSEQLCYASMENKLGQIIQHNNTQKNVI